MIGQLRGVAEQLEPGRVLLDVHGVGYLLRISLSTFYSLDQAPQGEPVVLRVHTHVREDALELFGFVDEVEKNLFELLIGVSGIGPRLALSILSGMAPEDLLGALGNADVARLTRIPGVGKKTAERLALELRESAQKLDLAKEEKPRAAAEPSVAEDAVAALVQLGYRASVAEQTVRAVVDEAPEAVLQDVLRQSLRRLARL